MTHAADVIAYTADADHWCETCAAEVYGPDYRCSSCGLAFPGFPGMREHRAGTLERYNEYGVPFTVTQWCGPIVPTGRQDSEGNEVHPLFGGDEWWEPSEPACEVLACSRCHAELDTAHRSTCQEEYGDEPCSLAEVFEDA